MRLLRIAEHENGNFHAAPESSAEGPRKILTRAPPSFHHRTTRLELKEEIANIDTLRILPRLTLPLKRILPPMPSTRAGTLMLRRSVQTEKSEGDLDGTNEAGSVASCQPSHRGG